MAGGTSETFGDKVREARKAQNLTQEHLAWMVGVAMITVSRWERGAHVPNDVILRRLARRLRVSPAWLLDEEEAA